MKAIKKYISEKLILGKDLIDKNQHISQKFAEPDANDTWTKNCLSALEDKFSSTYTIEQLWSGSINFYQKGKKPSLKSLICSIYGLDNGKLDAEFGSNENLENTLGKDILAVIKSV